MFLFLKIQGMTDPDELVKRASELVKRASELSTIDVLEEAQAGDGDGLQPVNQPASSTNSGI